MAKERSPQRAAAVLDRAARMKSFRPKDFKLGDLLDKQMRAPGQVKASPFQGFKTTDIAKSNVDAVGLTRVPISSLKTEQSSVSLKQAKAKIGAKGGGHPDVLLHEGKHYVLDGNHRLTAARAAGQSHIEVNVSKLKPGAEAKIAAAASKKAAEIAQVAKVTKIGGFVGAVAVAGAVAAAIWQKKEAAEKALQEQKLGSNSGNDGNRGGGETSAKSKEAPSRSAYTLKNGQIGHDLTQAQADAYMRRRKSPA